MRPRLWFLLLVAAPTLARAATIVSPTAGSINDASGIPFLTDTNVAASVRYQQVYGAADFARQGSPQYLITEVAFAGGPGGPIINIVLPNVEV